MIGHPARAITLYGNGLARELYNNVWVSNASKTAISSDEEEFGGVECKGVWDTGATNSVISERLVNRLELPVISEIPTSGVNGTFITTLHVVDLWLPNQILIPRLQVSKGILEEEDVLIGMDVITQGDFAISNYEGKTVFTYRVPSVAVADYVKLAQLTSQARSSKVDRNAPCPCGSGRKYKNCHGKS